MHRELKASQRAIELRMGSASRRPSLILKHAKICTIFQETSGIERLVIARAISGLHIE